MRQPDSLQTYMHLLQRVGWDPSALKPQRHLSIRPSLESEAVPARLVSLMRGEESIATLFVIDGVRLPSGMTLSQRFLDMTIEARLGLRAAALLAPAPYVLIASPYECFLYEAETEELLLSSTTPEDSAARIFSLFNASEQISDALDRIPRRNSEQWGKDLGDWLRVWSVKIGRAGRVPADVMKPLLAHFLLAWKNTLSTVNNQAPDPMNATIDATVDPAEGSALTPSPQRFYQQHVRPINQIFQFGIFQAYAEREEALWKDESIAPLLAGFLAEARLLSRTKYASGNLVHAFATAKTEHKSWLKLLSHDPKAGRRLHRKELNVVDAVTVDLAEDGYGWALAMLQDLVLYLIKETIPAKEAVKHQDMPGLQLDIFAPPPSGVGQDGTLEDILTYVVAHCFRARVPSAAERYNLALLVSAKLMELAESNLLPLNPMPMLDNIFD